ncbi:hypothetical protein CC80DRAFT_480477 [Byssothecium circinans]|uniref:Uncharacterized protein n=1 Tax=Byssothecium circinans TaxID=147558 RepID=A0A6A5TIY3_9PLEO|nr:hypothetical protein CC80DRAFT_480477 [Byssothecium circinans]
MVSSKRLAIASLTSIAIASPLHPRQDASTPCAQVSAAVAAQPNVAQPTVPASVAYECLTSVPIKNEEALKLLDSIKPYFRWQSTTAFLKNPPKEYAEKVQPGVDIWAKYDAIRSKVEKGGYANEYEFGVDLYTLTQSTHDGHFVYVPDSVGGIFNWARPAPLVSVSADGKELPKPYVYSDVLAESFSNSSFKSSAISKINGENATDYLATWAQHGSVQDRDALYNNLFYELATVSLGPVGSGVGTFAGGGRGRWSYPGASTELVFENGTTYKFDNYAKVLVSFDGITDGESLYQKHIAASTGSSSVSETAATAIPAPGYPPPVIREAKNLIGGYYLDATEYSDVAVLSVPSFQSPAVAEDFQQTAEKFLTGAKAAGKKKLVIDLSANGGGAILQGYDLYKQLFPTLIDHAAADRFRAFESTNLLGEYFSRASESLPRGYFPKEQDKELFRLQDYVVSSPLNYQTSLDVNSKNFPNWSAVYGPVQNYGDSFSNLFHWNLSDVNIQYNSRGILLHGYGIPSKPQPFAAEDVIVVTDGYCASTCTIFSELMRQRAGVKFISLGGRAKPGITQAVGGVKGTNNYPHSHIQETVKIALNELTTSTTDAEALYKTQLGEYADNTHFHRAAAGTKPNVNFRDGIREGDKSETPLQFIYEPSDCRIFYTKAMTVDVTEIWKAVVDSAFGGKNHCIAGSLGSRNNNTKRAVAKEMSEEDRVYSRSVHLWRRDLSAADYPLNVYTDLRGLDLNKRGIMWP